MRSLLSKTSILITVIILLISMQLIGCNAYADGKIRVAYLAPVEESEFWHGFGKFMHAVANDLDIDLKTEIAKNMTYGLKQAGLKILQDENKPDYFLTRFWPGVSENLLEIAEKRGIKTFIINTDIPVEWRSLIGKPRDKFKHWIGHMYPNDKQAGFDLADLLIHHAKSTALQNTSNIQIVGLGGNQWASPSIQRNKGLHERMGEHFDAKLNELVYCHWLRQTAELTTTRLIHKYADTVIVWSASDDMAIGAITSIQNNKMSPGKDIIVGGIDWSKEGLNAIANETLYASMGGHFMEGGWALLMIYDYHHNLDFDVKPGLEIKTTMAAITKDNIDSQKKILNAEEWDKIDFKLFSKHLNPKLQLYNFNPHAILSMLSTGSLDNNFKNRKSTTH